MLKEHLSTEDKLKSLLDFYTKKDETECYNLYEYIESIPNIPKEYLVETKKNNAINTCNNVTTDKLIASLENAIASKDEIIELLKQKIENLNKSNKSSENSDFRQTA